MMATGTTQGAGGRVLLVCQRSARLPFIFEAAQRAGIALVAVHDSEEPAPDGVPGIERSISLPVFSDPQLALDRLAAAAPALGVSGIITLREEAVVWTARAAERLGLAGLPVGVAQTTRNKADMRAAFNAAGMAGPRFARISDPTDLSPAADLEPPLVVKPAGGWSSTGVTLVENHRDLPMAARTVADIQTRDLQRFCHDRTADIVVEEYLDGPEFVVECFVDDAGVHALAVGDKGQPTGPWFEESVYRVRTDIDDPQIVAVVEEAVAGVRALGIQTGAAHAELRLDRRGRPHVLEVGARIGGSGVSHFIVEQATGHSFAELCLKAAMSQQTPALPSVIRPHRVSANYIIPLAGHGRFSGIDGLEAVAAHPDTSRVVTFLTPGMQVPAPPAFAGYPGFIFSVHDTQTAAAAYHEWLDRTVRVLWR